MNNKLEQISKFAYSTKETVRFTYDTAKQLIQKNIIGHFVECGVGAGAQIMAMKLAIDELSDKTTIYGFDSFEGIPLAGVFDAEQPGIGSITHDVMLPEHKRLVSSGITVHSKVNVLNNFQKVGISVDRVKLIEGWFQNTIHQIVPNLGGISFLRLDGDLYESTICCLANLYPLVVDGGVVVVDDWGLPGARKAVEDYFGDKLPEMKIVEGSGTVAYFIK